MVLLLQLLLAASLPPLFPAFSWGMLQLVQWPNGSPCNHMWPCMWSQEMHTTELPCEDVVCAEEVSTASVSPVDEGQDCLYELWCRGRATELCMPMV